MWAVLSSLAVLALTGAVLWCAYRAASTARTPQGAVGWVVFLLASPILAVPLYLFLGHHRYGGYIVARRQSARVAEGIRAFAARNAPASAVGPIDPAPFEQIAALPAARGNGGALLIDGAATFEAIFEAIDAARSYVLVQFYIIHDDDLGRALRDRLVAAAERGVTVRLMIDRIGSLKLGERYLEPLREAGVQITGRDTRGARFRFQVNFRNHRKTVITDGTTGFTGGLNVGDEYMGRSERFGPWRDTHLRLTGPMVAQLQLIFAEDWHWQTGEALFDGLTWETPHDPQDKTGLIIATGPGDGEDTGSLMFFAAIAAATRRVWIATPYFVPDVAIVSALKHAAMRGVDVRLLVPDVVDHRLPWLAAFAYFDEVAQSGVKVLRYTQGFMHQKVFVVDDALAAIGTANLDNRSFRLNFEATALWFDPDMASDVADMLSEDFKQTYQLDRKLAEQPAYIRYGAPVARLFSPLL